MKFENAQDPSPGIRMTVVTPHHASIGTRDDHSTVIHQRSIHDFPSENHTRCARTRARASGMTSPYRRFMRAIGDEKNLEEFSHHHAEFTQSGHCTDAVPPIANPDADTEYYPQHLFCEDIACPR